MVMATTLQATQGQDVSETPGYWKHPRSSEHYWMISLFMYKTGYVKIMLKKKLNPMVPKKRKFVISLQNWKKTNKRDKQVQL